MDESKNNLPTQPEDWRMLYQIAVEDIRFFKGQQWLVTYYLLLLFIVLTKATRLMKDFFSQYKMLSVDILVVIIIGIVGIYILSDLEASIERARCRVEVAKKNLPPEISKIFCVEGRELSVTRVLIAIQVLAVVVTLGVIIAITTT